MMKTLSLAVALAAAAVGGVQGRALDRRATPKCPEFTKSTFVVEQYQLYPENGDWDAKNCLVYFGALFNSTVAVYDPYEDVMVDIITFDGISLNPALHIGGVGVDPTTGLVSVVVDAGAAFLTNGKNVGGDNWIIKYNPEAKEVVWKLNITEVTGGKYGGFQDVEHDKHGNTYIVGTFPGTIMKVDPKGGAVTPWYVPETINNTAVSGYGGLATVAENDILLSNDNAKGEILRFDLSKEKGEPVVVKREPHVSFGGTDAILLPPKYGGSVLLVSENAVGITVLRSKDKKWETAEHLGTVPNDEDIVRTGGIVTAPLQIGDKIFMIEEFFADPFVPGGVAGNRTTFPLFDITDKVEKLLAAATGSEE